MDITQDAAKKDKFLQGVLGSSLTVIFFIAAAGVVAASGADGSGLGVGIAAAAGCASVAYVAKLVISSRA
ncbi:hypothetical protein [Arenimonas metalli]|uniref:Uncharacterized protein n=1 Tax=Arenimonas metalli CF5-1 TaxID=1384056 RepID=A0A091B367_9GAMM|nr:hypothetical protein [Arenimonas metalli]KFN46156.1 hypothetical protein N787_11360 [Arenimonas metalli CF5-1]